MAQQCALNFTGDFMQDSDVVQLSVVEWLNSVDYDAMDTYVPTEFAAEFVNFIKLVNGAEGTENKTPVIHLKMLDSMVDSNGLDVINLCHRGAAKSTVAEYLFLYLAVMGELPTFGEVLFAIYVSDSIDNGVKKMRKNLEFRYYNSPFLQKYIPTIKFTDIRWEFIRADGSSLVVCGYGASTGVRGTRENGSRPVLAVLDDLISDEDARSPTVLAAVEDTVYKAIDYALHPNKRKIIWSGTPFNASDPLYKAVESGAWNVNVYPVCEKFPCSEEEFKGSWPDRFNYAYVMKQYTKARLSGKIDTFNQELMLRIISDEERLVLDTDINWYSRNGVLHNKGMFNFYITTDFATSDKKSADYSVISVWALNSNGDWFWVDGICKKQHMDTNVDDLFRLVQLYRPQSVGIEVSGQQGGFVSLIQRKMIDTNIFFTLAQDINGNKVGIRPTVDKSKRFLDSVHPLFKSRKFYFPKELKEAPIMVEAMLELSLATHKGFKSKHDDFIDTISMLTSMRTFCPSADLDAHTVSNAGDTEVIWDFDHPDEEVSAINSYIV